TAAGAAGLHEARVEGVLQVALEDAVLDEHVALGRVALVVDVERTAPAFDRAVVDDRHAGRRHPLADTAGEYRGALAVEVALEAVADRLVEQHARPAGAEHDGHLAGPRGARLEIGQGGVDRGADIAVDDLVGEVVEVEASAAAGMALLAPAILLGDDGQRQAHQRTDVTGDEAVGPGDEDRVVLGGKARHDLANPRVGATGALFDALEQRHLGGGLERLDRIGAAIEPTPGAGLEARREPHRAGAAARDRAGRTGGLEQGVEADGIRIRERGLVADDGAHPDALVDRIAARLDDAFLEAPAFAAGVLEVQVGVVDTVVENLGERTLQVRFVEPGRLEQDGSGLGQSGQGWICDFHTPMLQQAPPDSAGARAW